MTTPLGTFHKTLKVDKIGMFILHDQTVFGTEHTWHYSLHSFLRINITFYHIHFTYMNLHKCFIGNVTVISDQYHREIYCGIHSLFLSYPSHKKVNITVLSAYRVQYNLMLDYSVIDEGRIKSFIYNINLRNISIPVWTVYFLKHQIRTLHLHITVLKYQRIMLKITIVNFALVEVYDGPGLLSESLLPANKSKENQKIYYSSSFLCVLTFWLKEFINLAQYFKFSWFINNPSQQTPLKENNVVIISYPEIHRKCSITVLQVSTNNDLNINISINIVSYKGMVNTLCQHAGLAVFSEKYGIYKELSVVCSTDKRYPHRKIFSNSPNVVLVFYCFQGYGEIKIEKIILSTTKCRAVPINTCVFDRHCSTMGNYCSSLKVILSQENIEAYGFGNPTATKYGRAFFKVRGREGNCIIY